MISESAHDILTRRAREAKENRLAMPLTYAQFDATRELFGDGVSIRYVNENGIERDKRIEGIEISARDMVLERAK